MDKQKITIIALTAVLVLALQYIILDNFLELKEGEMIQVFQNGYEEGLTDAIATIYLQTQNCQSTTITLFNATKEIFDLSCLKQEPQTSP